MAAGKITTGLSLPYVALYAASGGTITYTSGQKLGRAVNINLSVESSDDNDFYADNILAETENGKFTSGSVDITIDGLLPATRRLIFGLPAAGSDGWTNYGDDMQVPYVGIGVIYRHQSGGVVTYTPIVLYKCKFNQPSDEASTQEETINWQPEALSAKIHRADDSNHNWKSVGSEFETEAAAEAALRTKLGIS